MRIHIIYKFDRCFIEFKHIEEKLVYQLQEKLNNNLHFG